MERNGSPGEESASKLDDGTSNQSSPEPATPVSDADYEVLKLIGKGGYGEVRLVRDRSLVCHAVKVVYRASFESDRPYEREYEGICKFESVSRLSPCQLQIIHVGRRDDAGYFYYIMEAADDVSSGRDIVPAAYIPRTLKSDLEKQGGRIPAGECCRIGIALAAALENLHVHRLVHRDVKPANIIFVNGLPKLADPGLVTDADQSVSCAGTEGYIPPEGPGSTKADIYSLGMVLYEICTGCHRRDFPKLPEGFADLPDHELRLKLNKIYTKACQSNLRKRYQSARQMRLALESLLHPQPRARHKIALAVGIAVLATAAIVPFSNVPTRQDIHKTEVLAASPSTSFAAPALNRSWTNSLGMIFAPVADTKALFSIWDTRVQDYATFVAYTQRAWKKPAFEQSPTHPAVNVSWSDARAFCDWLTKKEQREGLLQAGVNYRLPTDAEWSAAAESGTESGNTPAEKDVSAATGQFPWGPQWPPPPQAGNYAEDLKTDNFVNTSPVGSFSPNRFGLFDMGGNVWQWCEDSFDGDQRKRVARGSSYADNRKEDICLSHRFWGYEQSGVEWRGFRCVLDLGINSTAATK